MAELLEAQGFAPNRIVIDPSASGASVLHRPVFEAELTFEDHGYEDGRPRPVRIVAGERGAMHDLVQGFTGQEVAGDGRVIGVGPLLAALRAKGRIAGRGAGAGVW